METKIQESKSLYGRIIKIRNRKNITFADMITKNGIVQLIIFKSKERAKIRPQHYCYISGISEISNMKKNILRERKDSILVNHIEPIGIPSRTFLEQIYRGKGTISKDSIDIYKLRKFDIRQKLQMRDESLSRSVDFLEERGFQQIIPPVIRGKEATEGQTNAFSIKHSSEKLFLAVSNLDFIRSVVAIKKIPVFQVAPLFWSHKYSKSNSLNEFLLLEFAIPEDNLTFLMELHKSLLLNLCDFLQNNCQDDDYIKYVSKKINSGIPVVQYYEVIDFLRHENLISDGKIVHELSSSYDERICQWLASPIYWMVGAPASIVPNYVASNDKGISYDCELRLIGPGAIASGSIWEKINENLLNSSLRSKNAPKNTYIKGSGMSVGLDRTLLGLLKPRNIRSLLFFPRDRKWRPLNLESVMNSTILHKSKKNNDIKSLNLHKRNYVGIISQKLQQIRKRLKLEGFFEFYSPYLSSLDELLIGNVTPPFIIDFFEHKVTLRTSHILYHLYVSACDRHDIFEISPIYYPYLDNSAHPWKVLMLTAVWRLKELNYKYPEWNPSKLSSWQHLLNSNNLEHLIKSKFIHKKSIPFFLRQRDYCYQIVPRALYCTCGRLIGWYGELVTKVEDLNANLSFSNKKNCDQIIRKYQEIIETGLPPLAYISIILDHLKYISYDSFQLYDGIK